MYSHTFSEPEPVASTPIVPGTTKLMQMVPKPEKNDILPLGWFKLIDDDCIHFFFLLPHAIHQPGHRSVPDAAVDILLRWDDRSGAGGRRHPQRHPDPLRPGGLRDHRRELLPAGWRAVG